MKKEIYTYLKKRPNAEVLALTLVAVIGFLILLFRPVKISDWVEQNERWLLWTEVGLLLAIVIVLLRHVSNLLTQIDQLRKQQGEQTDTSIQMFNFYDERGDLKLSVKSDKLYYLEAADNYVLVYYQHSNKIQNIMIRNSLKNIEWRFKDTTLKRCHRSYLINIAQVQMVKRIDGEVYMDFNESKIKPVPVSKAYADHVIPYFTK